MNFVNQAANLWQTGKLDKAIEAYETALAFCPGDPHATELLAYVCLIDGQRERAHALLTPLRNHIPDHAVSTNALNADILDGNADATGVAAIFQHVDETRTSILEKQTEIREILDRQPNFRQGWFHLAITWLQLGRNKEALQTLHHYHTLDPSDATAEYYIAALSLERYNYPEAWQHLQNAEALTAARDYSPKPLEELRRGLQMRSPA